MAYDQVKADALNDLEAAEARVRQLQAVLREIARMPTVQRNPDGVDQAAATMQMLARTALEGPYGEPDHA